MAIGSKTTVQDGVKANIVTEGAVGQNVLLALEDITPAGNGAGSAQAAGYGTLVAGDEFGRVIAAADGSTAQMVWTIEGTGIETAVSGAVQCNYATNCRGQSL